MLFRYHRVETSARVSRADSSRGFKEADFLPPRGILMPIDRRRLLQVVAILGALFAYTTIVVGGIVRGMDAGLACPDWPLCNGSVVPNLADARILVEYIHRLVAALTGLFMLSTLVVAALWLRPEMRIVTLSVAAIGRNPRTSRSKPRLASIAAKNVGTATWTRERSEPP